MNNACTNQSQQGTNDHLCYRLVGIMHQNLLSVLVVFYNFRCNINLDTFEKEFDYEQFCFPIYNGEFPLSDMTVKNRRLTSTQASSLSVHLYRQYFIKIIIPHYLFFLILFPKNRSYKDTLIASVGMFRVLSSSNTSLDYSCLSVIM